MIAKDFPTMSWMLCKEYGMVGGKRAGVGSASRRTVASIPWLHVPPHTIHCRHPPSPLSLWSRGIQQHTHTYINYETTMTKNINNNESQHANGMADSVPEQMEWMNTADLWRISEIM